MKLPDGTDVDVRPITPDDAAALVTFHSRLSADSRRMRFFNPHPHLSSTEVTWLTDVDHHDRQAYVVMADTVLLGVGRLDRIPDSADAEVAFVVTDARQGQGIGTALLMSLASHARSEGILRLIADTLCENHAMIAVFRQSGLPTFRSRDHGVYHYEITL